MKQKEESDNVKSKYLYPILSQSTDMRSDKSVSCKVICLFPPQTESQICCPCFRIDLQKLSVFIKNERERVLLTLSIDSL